jgi:hypothetical protein
MRIPLRSDNILITLIHLNIDNDKIKGRFSNG